MTILYKYLAKVIIELTTPLHVGNGHNNEDTDSPVILDPNGLPTIPGSSIAGVLRSEFKKTYPESEENLFGFQNKNEGRGSLLSVSWASIHNSNNIPAEKLLTAEQLNDALLVLAKNQPIRDHVRINHKGASDSEDTDGNSGHGKFDEAIVNAGNRFSFELEMSIDNKETGDKYWNKLLTILHKPVLRFGGRSRRGLGAFKIISCKEACFDLKTQLQAYLDTDVQLNDSKNILKEYKNQSTSLENYKEITLELEPESYFMFGGGIDKPTNEKEADMAPVKEQVIKWNNNHGTIQENNIVIPGSSVKGAISHRVAYYYNLLKQRWAEDTNNPKSITSENNEAVKELFGYCKDNNVDGARGKVIINDTFVSPSDYSQKLIHHVSIDRFTGGAIPGNLFSERPICSKNKLLLKLYVESNALSDSTVKDAFRRTLKDLISGRLQLGAGSGRGHGYFKSDKPLPEF